MLPDLLSIREKKEEKEVITQHQQGQSPVYSFMQKLYIQEM
jgi:hypothetical protein